MRCLPPPSRYAEEGFPVSPVISQLWRRAGPVFIGTADPALDEWARVFTFDGRTPDAGEIWRSPDHAATLRRLASEGPRDFYEGETAGRIAAHAEATGGLIDGDDLAAFHSEWVEPISIVYRDHEVWEIPPNGQGIAALQALGIVEGTAMHESPHASAGSWHWQIEAMKLAFADAYRYVADPRRADRCRSAACSTPATSPRAGLCWEIARRTTDRAGRRAAGRCTCALRIATA